MKFSGVTILQGVEFSIFPIDFEWALQQCIATALPVIRRLCGIFLWSNFEFNSCQEKMSFKSILCLITSDISIFTLPAGALAKYCDEHVCVCVCVSVYLSARISPEPHARSLLSFCAYCLWPLDPALAR